VTTEGPNKSGKNSAIVVAVVAVLAVLAAFAIGLTVGGGIHWSAGVSSSPDATKVPDRPGRQEKPVAQEAPGDREERRSDPNSESVLAALQEKAATEKPAPAAAPKRPGPGRLIVRIEGQNYRTPSGHTPSFGLAGPWIYVNGRLKEKGRFETTLALEPGNYVVEVGYATHYKDFPLWFDGRRIKIDPDRDSTTNFNPPRLEDPYHGVYGLGCPPRQGYQKWYQHWIDQADVQLKLYELDPVAKALAAAGNLLPDPSRGVVAVELSERHGGRRELDAAQVRLIVGWLHYHYWDRWYSPQIARLVDSAYGPDIGEWDRKMDLLKGLVQNQQDRIEQLNSLARRLEQARD
jgi:hypothetical protein